MDQLQRKHVVNLKNFNPLDGQILGVFKKERKDGGEDVQILEIKKGIGDKLSRQVTKILTFGTNPLKVKYVALTVRTVSVSGPYKCNSHLTIIKDCPCLQSLCEKMYMVYRMLQ